MSHIPPGSLFFVVALLVATVLGPAAVFAQQPLEPEEVAAMFAGGGTEEFVLGEVIVKLKPAAEATADVSAMADGFGDEVERTSGGELVLKIDASLAASMAAGDLRAETLRAVEEMQANPDVEYAQPNYILQIARTVDDTRFPEQWHYRTFGSGAGESDGGIGLTEAWDVTTGDASVVVAVIDTGILPGHPDIVGSPNLLPGFDMISSLSMANDGDGRDDDPTDPGDAVAAGECGIGSEARDNSWHGTHVAGTVGVGRTDNRLGVAGVNHRVGVVPVRVLGKCGGSTTDIADGIRWAAGLPVPGVAANPNPARILNMSLRGVGTCASSPVQQNAIHDAVAAGVTVVVAAGNDARDASGFRPASCDGVITVAASETRGRLATRYSNFGATVEIMAPGGDVLRNDDGDGNPDGVLSMVDPSAGSYAFYNGTSMAAPHVAGVAALMLAVDPSLTPAEILAKLQATARLRSASECPQLCGAGLLDANAAVRALPPVSFLASRLEVRQGRTAALEVITNLPAVAVTLGSADPGIATVAPTTVITDASGRASTTVTGVAVGTTTLDASTAGGSAQVSVEVRKKTPALPRWGLVLLALSAIWLLLRHERKLA